MKTKHDHVLFKTPHYKVVVPQGLIPSLVSRAWLESCQSLSPLILEPSDLLIDVAEDAYKVFSETMIRENEEVTVTEQEEHATVTEFRGNHTQVVEQMDAESITIQERALPHHDRPEAHLRKTQFQTNERALYRPDQHVAHRRTHVPKHDDFLTSVFKGFESALIPS